MPSKKTDRCKQPHQHRGSAIVMVLGTLAITFALSYAILYTQTIHSQIQFNSELNVNAKAAATTAMTIAIRKMHQSDWPGVDTTLSDSLSETESYQVTYTTGDPSLSAGDPDYSDYPYRVTLLATGYAADPSDNQIVASYQIQVVMRLIPKALTAEPTNWNEANQYTYFQRYTGNDDNAMRMIIDIPCRIDGPCRVQSTLSLCEDYPGNANATTKWLQDILLYKTDGGPDYRPLTGPIHLKAGATNATNLAYLSNLGVSSAEYPSLDLNLVFATSPSTYQLFPGGKFYSIGSLAEILENETLSPDIVSNPLGVYSRPGGLDINDNVTIEGTILGKNSGSDIKVKGKNISWVSVKMPALLNSTKSIQLPAAIVLSKFRVKPGAKIVMQGLIAVGSNMEFESTNKNEIEFSLSGRIISQRFHIHEHDKWNKSDPWWYARWQLHKLTDALAPYPATPVFPIWLKLFFGLDPQPKINISPPASDVSYHWTTFDQPIYAAHADDEGLMWDLIRWSDNP